MCGEVHEHVASEGFWGLRISATRGHYSLLRTNLVGASREGDAARRVEDSPRALAGGWDGDVLHGFSGDDEIKGRKGHDLLRGSEGDDALDGGAGVDDCRAKPGASDSERRCEI